MSRFQPSDLSPENRLILRMASPVPRPGGSGDLFRDEPDWNAVLGIAARHQLLSNLALAASGSPVWRSIPEPFSTRLRKIRKGTVISDDLQVEQLSRILDSMRRGGIEVMLIKGLSLSERLYPDPAERFSGDIDILVRPPDVPAAGRILEQLGFAPFREELFRDVHFHIPYFQRQSGSGTIVELHWDVNFRDSTVRFDTGSWWDRAQEAELRPGRVLLPPAEEEIVYTCFHALSRGMIQLRDVSDLARLRRLGGDALSWDRVLEYASVCGAEPLLRMMHGLCEALWPIRKIDLPPPGSEVRLKLKLLSNLTAPQTVLQAGNELWWPYSRIMRWATLARKNNRAAILFSGSDPFLDRLHAAGPHPSQHLPWSRIVPRVLAGAVCCFLPLSLFPATGAAHRSPHRAPFRRAS